VIQITDVLNEEKHSPQNYITNPPMSFSGQLPPGSFRLLKPAEVISIWNDAGGSHQTSVNQIIALFRLAITYRKNGLIHRPLEKWFDDEALMPHFTLYHSQNL
jgi:hypothetical protein